MAWICIFEGATMFRLLTTSLSLLAAVPAMADSLLDFGSLFDPGVDLTSIVGNGGVTQGTTSINPEYANLNSAASFANTSAPGMANFNGLPGMDSASAQTLANDPKLRLTLDFFLRCIAQNVPPQTIAQTQEDDLFGFGAPAQSAFNIGDTSNPIVKYCIQMAGSQAHEYQIHVAQAALTAIEQQQRQQQQHDLSVVMTFLSQNGGDQEMMNLLPILLGNGDASSLLFGGF